MSRYYSGIDIREIDDALYAEWVAAGNPKAQQWTLLPPEPAPGPMQTVRWDGTQWVIEMIDPAQEKARVGAMVQAWIDGICSGGVPYFRDIFSARGYVGDPNPAYHARAVLLRDWSSSVWTYLDGVAADVMSGQRLPPTDAELMAELPQPPEGAV
jgi:hypothetical protein